MLTILWLSSILLSLHAFQFNEKGEFTILQLTDFHSGESDEKDLKTWKFWDMIVPIAQPDLVVISGDAISGGFAHQNGTLVDGFYKKCWTNFTSYFEDKGLFYAHVIGNHDDEGDYNRTQIIDLDKTSPFSVLGLSQNTQMNNTANYWFPIYSRTDPRSIAVIVWVFDTHDTNCRGNTSSWGCIDQDQLEWYDAESQKIKEKYGTNIHHIAYLHIPIPEYMAVYNSEDFYSRQTENISCPLINTGFFSHVKKNGDISAMYVGHDHWNDFGGYYQGVELVYGRRSGYGGYANLVGARVLKLSEATGPNSTRVITRNSYLIQEDGSIEESAPSRPRSAPIQDMCAPAFPILKELSSAGMLFEHKLMVSLVCLLVLFY